MELPSPMYLGAGGTDHSQIGYDPHLNGGLSLQEMQKKKWLHFQSAT